MSAKHHRLNKLMNHQVAMVKKIAPSYQSMQPLKPTPQPITGNWSGLDNWNKTIWGKPATPLGNKEDMDEEEDQMNWYRKVTGAALPTNSLMNNENMEDEDQMHWYQPLADSGRKKRSKKSKRHSKRSKHHAKPHSKKVKHHAKRVSQSKKMW